MKEVFDKKEVLDKIVPSSAERRQCTTIITEFLSCLQAKLKDEKAILGGSGAKDTWLAGNHDVDIFVLFPFKQYSSVSGKLSDLLEPRLKKAFAGISIERLHGSRDYFQLNYKSLSFEIIPILKISKASQAKNITDISPLHALWVNKHTPKIKNEIRLAKQFLRAQHLYGAESYISGFSGYVVEILIAHYGSFQKFLQAAVNWKVKEVIDVEKYYPKKDGLFQLNQSKTQSPVIVIDPVDSGRNTAAALSLEKFLQLQQIAKEFLRKPATHFFTEKKLDLSALTAIARKRQQSLVYLELSPLAGKEDVIGMKIRKVFDFLKTKLAVFSVVESDCNWSWGQPAILYFFLKNNLLPLEEIRIGPPLALKEHVQDFKRKNKNTFIQDGKVMAKIKTPFPQLADFMRVMLQDAYVLERIKKVSQQLIC